MARVVFQKVYKGISNLLQNPCVGLLPLRLDIKLQAASFPIAVISNTQGLPCCMAQIAGCLNSMLILL